MANNILEGFLDPETYLRYFIKSKYELERSLIDDYDMSINHIVPVRFKYSGHDYSLVDYSTDNLFMRKGETCIIDGFWRLIPPSVHEQIIAHRNELGLEGHYDITNIELNFADFMIYDDLGDMAYWEIIEWSQEYRLQAISHGIFVKFMGHIRQETIESRIVLAISEYVKLLTDCLKNTLALNFSSKGMFDENEEEGEEKIAFLSSCAEYYRESYRSDLRKIYSTFKVIYQKQIEQIFKDIGEVFEVETVHEDTEGNISKYSGKRLPLSSIPKKIALLERLRVIDFLHKEYPELESSEKMGRLLTRLTGDNWESIQRTLKARNNPSKSHSPFYGDNIEQIDEILIDKLEIKLPAFEMPKDSSKPNSNKGNPLF